MELRLDQARGGRRPRAAFRALAALKGGPGVLAGLLLVIWVGLPLLPEGTGLRFGTGYRIFFTAMLLLGALLFWFLELGHVPQPRKPVGVLLTLVAVYSITVGLLVTVGIVYPQFALPRPPRAAALEAVERGRDLFWSSNVGCFRCHVVSGAGGTRGPDLTHVASRAGERVAGLPAEEYLRAKVSTGLGYDYKVPGYVPIMPPYAQALTREQMEDVLAFLRSLK